MSVFTQLDENEALGIATAFGLKGPLTLAPISHGTQNSNYWLTTSTGEYVLTIVEELAVQNLQNITEFICYLSEKDIPCPLPLKNSRQCAFEPFQNKQAVILKRLPGAPIDPPSPYYAEKIGSLLADLHNAAENYAGPRGHNTRGQTWRQDTYSRLMPFLMAHEKRLIEPVMTLDKKMDWKALRMGMIHADLFTDNVLWEKENISGVIDFYFACEDAFIYDLAITLNDWCFTLNGSLKKDNTTALLSAYCAKRSLTPQERSEWKTICRVAALRFWLSRRWALQFPPLGREVMQKDPEPFLKILSFHEQEDVALP